MRVKATFFSCLTYLVFGLGLVLLDDLGEGGGRLHHRRHHAVAARVVLEALRRPLGERELTVHLFPLIVVLNHAIERVER